MEDFQPLEDSSPHLEAHSESQPFDIARPLLPQRQDTTGTDGGGGGETCRICRSEGTPEEPLFYPCKCSGSIRYVHQECLMEWLSHSHKKHCELCKTPFRFTKLYDANMPPTLPWTVFVRRACIHVAWTTLRVCRGFVVGTVWLAILPWLVRWAWRWMFWFADAGWARDQYLRTVRDAHSPSNDGASQLLHHTTAALQDSLYATFENIWASSFGSVEADSVDREGTSVPSPLLSTPATNISNVTDHLSRADVSVLSSWTYLANMTPNRRVNRIILDIFEGQLITCVVITGFILVFLIREWVVQQQPLANLEVLQNEQREREEREQERERLRRHAELVEQARHRLLALENDVGGSLHLPPPAVGSELSGWGSVSEMIDAANAELDVDGAGPDAFALIAAGVMRELVAAESAGAAASELADAMFTKLEALPQNQRELWEDVLVAEIQKTGLQQDDPSYTQTADDDQVPEGSTSRRPPMPTRDTVSRATQIQRRLEETESAETSGDGKSHAIPSTEDINPTSDSSSNASNRLAAGSETEDETSGRTDSGNSAAIAIETINLDAQTGKIELPITNAGPDAKVNIKQRGKTRARPIVAAPEEPIDQSPTIRAQELRQKIMDKLDQLSANTANSPADTDNGPEPQGPAGSPAASPASLEPSIPDVDDMDGSELSDEMNAYRHEDHLNSDTAEEAAQLRAAELGYDAVADPDPVTDSTPVTNSAPNQSQLQVAAPAGLSERLADWFWGDIPAATAQEPAPPPPNEERLDDTDGQAAFVPVQDGPGVVGADVHNEQLADHEPDFAAAVPQAGLDAEAVEDAEDLEGVFELIGLQGPLIGLFQTSCFCSVLVISTVGTAIGAPYMIGKLVLLFLREPLTFIVKSPLRMISFLADLLVDFGLLVLGYSAYISLSLVRWLASLVESHLPFLGLAKFPKWISDFAESTGRIALNRLLDMFNSGNGTAAQESSWHWSFLNWSLQAHASLKIIQDETNVVLSYIGSFVTTVVETISSGSVSLAWERSMPLVRFLSNLPAELSSILESFALYAQPWIAAISSLRTGSLILPASNRMTPVDPSLVYWNAHDRGMAVTFGYLALAMIAAAYVAIDTPITRSHAGQRTEKALRDSLRQAGGVLKVIVIISIEMLVFPLYCGLLLDLAFLPLQQNASVVKRWTYATQSPYTFCFVHWFIGTCYMFHFALFVGMCRKILRKGVLWFIRDPDDPTFHPVRDVLERNLTTQLRKIAFSALVYGALVILCLGGVIWSIGKLFQGIFPVHWISTEPMLESPLALLLFVVVTPRLFKLAKPSTVLQVMYNWWLRKCARALRLSHFLFDERRKDEEGHVVHHTWRSVLLPGSLRSNASGEDAESSGIRVEHDGKYVLTPCTDQYRPPKPGEAFLYVDENDVYIGDKHGNKSSHFAKIYVPPFFRLRLAFFMVCLWLFSAFTGLCATLVPLCFGRYALSTALPQGVVVNDIYAYSLGAYTIGGLMFALLKGGPGLRYVRQRAAAVDLKAWARVAQRYTSRTLKCVYVYGFAALVAPCLLALLLQFYFFLPLHTYLVSSIRPALADAAGNMNATVAENLNDALNNETAAVAGAHEISVAEHGIHLLSDSALGVMISQLLLRNFVGLPTSRAAEAFRRVTIDGYFNPNARLATRFFILPASLVSLFLLCAPLGLANTVIGIARFSALDLAPEAKILIYRYSYPLAAAWVAMSIGGNELAKATKRWRARVRDEVYLVGERLHNFGEKRPPMGSKSVVRKEK